MPSLHLFTFLMFLFSCCKQELRQHDTNVADQAISIVENKLNTRKRSLEGRRRRKIATLLESRTRTRPTNRHPRVRAPPPRPHDHSDNPRTVVNLSDIELTEAEHHLLSKGLKFAPKPPRINIFQLKQDLEDFDRRLHLREFFYDPQDEEETTQRRQFKEKSTWTPHRNREAPLEMYIRAVKKDILQTAQNTRPRGDNLNQEERKALRGLKTRQDIVIKPADKGSATVVISREAYISEADRQLNNTNHYRKLDRDLTSQRAEQVTSLVHTMVENREISKETRKYLTPSNPRMARFYHLPKLHKPGNPGRPIVSSSGAPTERISEFVDYHLQPLVIQLPSYLRDTKEFLRRISNLDPSHWTASYSPWMSAPCTPTSRTTKESKPADRRWTHAPTQIHPRTPWSG